MESLIHIEHLQKSFGKKQVLADVSLTVGPGEVHGLVGLNGAGKTTLLRCALGLLSPDAGTCLLQGLPAHGIDPALYRKVGVVIDDDGFSGTLSVRENLRFFAAAKGMSRVAADAWFDEFWADSDVGRDNRPVRLLSRGQKMQCALMRAFVGNPLICLLDEPAASLDMEAYSRFAATIRDAQERGCACIISTHQLDLIEDLCTKVSLLKDGGIVSISAHSKSLWRLRTLRGGADLERIRLIVPSVRMDLDAFLCDITDEATAAGVLRQLVGTGVAVSEFSRIGSSLRRRIVESYEGGSHA